MLESVSTAGAPPLPPELQEWEVDGQLPQGQGCDTQVPEGLLWSSDTVVHLLLTRGSRTQQPAPPGLDPPHSLPNQVPEKHLVCFPDFAKCPLVAGWKQGWSMDGIFTMGLRGT